MTFDPWQEHEDLIGSSVEPVKVNPVPASVRLDRVATLRDSRKTTRQLEQERRARMWEFEQRQQEAIAKNISRQAHLRAWHGRAHDRTVGYERWMGCYAPTSENCERKRS